MLTDTQWDRLLNPAKTAEHIHIYANEVYNRKDSAEPHILYTLKCLSELPRAEQSNWYIVEDVVYHLPTYTTQLHKYSEQQQQWFTRMGKRGPMNKTRTQ